MKDIPYGLIKILRQRTGKTRHVIVKTILGDRVDIELTRQIDEILKEYAEAQEHLNETINRL